MYRKRQRKAAARRNFNGWGRLCSDAYFSFNSVSLPVMQDHRMPCHITAVGDEEDNQITRGGKMLEEKAQEEQEIRDIADALIQGQSFKSGRNWVNFHSIIEDEAGDVDLINRMFGLMNSDGEKARMTSVNALMKRIDAIVLITATTLHMEGVRV